jgi:hypothetical protein
MAVRHATPSKRRAQHTDLVGRQRTAAPEEHCCGAELQLADSLVPREAVLGWYSDGLRPKVARAVTEGRVDAERAAELHRLMTELLGARLLHTV